MFVVLRITNYCSYICELNEWNIKNMTHIKVLRSGCSRCKTTYGNVLEALKPTNIEAMMKYNILTTSLYLIRLSFKLFECDFCTCTSSRSRGIAKAIPLRGSSFRRKIHYSKMSSIQPYEV